MTAMKRILIIDDDDDFREALEAALTPAGFRIQHAANGVEALQVLREDANVPCAMLIDLMMPKMDGWTLLDELGRDPDLARIPSAVVSAARDTGTLPEAMPRFSKPCDLDDLLRFLSSACSDGVPAKVGPGPEFKDS
jgi:CheY-like chemotaxis protein